MAGHGEKFGRKKEDAIVALLSQRNVEDAARAAGIGARTLLRWLQTPEFQAVIHRLGRLGVAGKHGLLVDDARNVHGREVDTNGRELPERATGHKAQGARKVAINYAVGI
jgi:hypothetical protein